jgi:hypothetical protein
MACLLVVGVYIRNAHGEPLPVLVVQCVHEITPYTYTCTRITHVIRRSVLRITYYIRPVGRSPGVLVVGDAMSRCTPLYCTPSRCPPGVLPVRWWLLVAVGVQRSLGWGVRVGYVRRVAVGN